MIPIETIENDDARCAPSAEIAPYRFRLGFLEICCLVFAALLIGSVFGGTLTLLRVPPDWAYSVGLLAGVAFAFRLYRKGLSENELTARMQEFKRQVRTLAKRYGYLPPVEGASQRHRATISRIDAVWPVDDFALDDLGPGQIVRTAEREYIYCAGEAFAEHDDVENSVFYLKETMILELSGDLDCVDSVAMSGQRVPIAGDEVAAAMLPEELLSLGFAILEDLELIRRLPPIANDRA